MTASNERRERPESVLATAKVLPGFRPRRLLIIDDNEAIHRDFRKGLLPASDGDKRVDQLREAASNLFGTDSDPTWRIGANFDIDHAHSGEMGIAMAQAALDEDQPYEMAFVDVRMPPGIDGITTIGRLWKIDERLQTCVCTAYSDRDWQDVLGELGPSDRLLILKKPFDLIEIRQIAVALSEKWRLSRLAERQVNELELLVRSRTAELQRALVLDRLTSLPNRRTFNDRLAKAIKRRRTEPNYKFGLVFLGIDRFKVINDAVGHDGGDELLRQIGRRLDEAVRATDTVGALGRRSDNHGRRSSDPEDAVKRAPSSGLFASKTKQATGHTAARIGGDEFVVLLDSLTNEDDGEIVADRLMDILSMPYHVKGKQLDVTVSLGVTSSRLNYASPEEMLRDADAAMHRGKSLGRGRVISYNAKMQEEARQRTLVEHDLRGAAERGELRVVYQPIVHAADGTLAGHEALIRWHHPQQGLLSPVAFIAAAEESGLVCELGDWMLRTAAQEYAGWLGESATPLDVTMNVNLSRKQLIETDLVSRVAKVIEVNNLKPGQLKLEVTEGGVMENPTDSVRVLRELKALGTRIVIDDFGTGYSSLACLHQFPLDCVKLDRSFIRQLETSNDYAAVIEAIVTLTRALDIELVAEGVETAAQWGVLRDMGCDLLQGYYFGKPLDPAVARGITIATPGRSLCDGLLVGDNYGPSDLRLVAAA